MTAANFDAALAQILKEEAGFSNNRKDPGGATNLGVTLRTLSAWDGRQATIEELKALTPTTVAPIYHTNYWNAVRADALPSGVDLWVFDAAVNCGPGRAVRFLQHGVMVLEDGVIGPHTLQAVADVTTPAAMATVIHRMALVRASYYQSLPTFDTFGNGWMNRLAEVTQLALEWAGVANTGPGEPA